MLRKICNGMNFFKSTTGIVIGAAVLVLIAGSLAFFLDKDPEPGEKLEPLGTEYPDQGNAHIQIGAAHEHYNSNPPTSGPHYANAATKAFYEESLADEQLVHNLEHGEIWISYKEAGELIKQELRSFQGRFRGSVVVTSRPQNEKNICLASWRRLLCLDQFDQAVAQNFLR